MPTWRPATAADAEAVLVLMEAFYREEHLEFEPTCALEGLIHLMANPPLGTTYILAVGGNAPQGYLVLCAGYSLEFRGKYYVLDEIFLKPEVRGRGLGKAGVDLAAAWARSQGARTVRLEVTRHNPKALRLYEKAGFQNDQREIMTRWV